MIQQPQQKPHRKPGRPPKVERSGFLEPAEVSAEVETHDTTDETGNDDILSRAMSAAASATPSARLSKTQRYKANKKARDAEFSNVVVTVLSLVFSAWQAPEDLKPNEDEVNAFSVPATKLLLRHVNITGKLTQDTMDIIGMVAAMSMYYVRTSTAWTEYNAARRAEQKAKQKNDNEEAANGKAGYINQG